ncbi:MAG: phosphatidylglycerophosphatase A [Betaproteobacteria bacterium]|nr:phosphatidylglycerophosphatase A [Betaproteobacteria bacterium]
MNARPNLAFLFRHPAHFIALGFGAGLAPVAPGTFGTLVAIPIAVALNAHAGDGTYVAVVAVLLVVGAWAAQVTGHALGVPDHGSLVIDEVAAFVLVLFFTGTTPLAIALAFGLFRFFDIVKPPPIRQLDAALKNGIGVMADDVLAALYAVLVYAVGVRILGG